MAVKMSLVFWLVMSLHYHYGDMDNEKLVT